MLPTGYSYSLTVKRIEHSGAWLEADDQEIFLPRLEFPGDLTSGKKVDVFIFLDRDAKQRATTRRPAGEVDEFAFLQVRSIGPHGTFMDWGLEKDLLCPFSEQPQRMLEGRRYLVRICHDQQGRPIASARLDRFVEKENQDLREGDEVTLLLWAFTELGLKVIVNNRYEALLYKDEIDQSLKRGQTRKGYVLRIRDDRRIDISLRRPGAAGVDDARQVILNALQPSGYLPLHDQSDPINIRNSLGLSKKVFKKAVGGLYKEGLIELTESGIQLSKPTP